MPNSVVKSFAKKYNLSVSEVERHWQTAKATASETLPPSSPDFYALVVGILKKILKGKQGKQKEEYMTDAERRRKIKEIKREARRRMRRLRHGEMEDKTG